MSSLLLKNLFKRIYPAQSLWLLFVKGVICLIFGYVLLKKSSGLVDVYMSAYSSPEYSFFNWITFKIFFKYFYGVFTILIPFLGVFTNKKIGWVLIASYFYHSGFFTVNTINFDYLLPNILILFIPFGFIVLLNLKTVAGRTFHLSSSELIWKNIIAFSLGVVMSIINIWMKYYYLF